jgi:hypothetical protein
MHHRLKRFCGVALREHDSPMLSINIRANVPHVGKAGLPEKSQVSPPPLDPGVKKAGNDSRAF